MGSLKVMPAELDGMVICSVQGCNAVIFGGREICLRCEEEICALEDVRAEIGCVERSMTLGEKLLNATIMLGVLAVIWEVVYPFVFQCLEFWGKK